MTLAVPELGAPDMTESVTTIFAREIRTGHEDRYEQWLAGISSSSAKFVGSQGTTILRPAEGREQYIAITQFDSAANLEVWMESSERETWLSKLESINVCQEDVMSLAGVERWFTLPGTAQRKMPPRYKTAALVFLGLYPLVLLLDVVLGPLLSGLPAPLRTFISLVVSVSLMVWAVLPALTKLFAGWLHPREPR